MKKIIEEIEPLGDHVAIKPLEAESRSASGRIIIPDPSKDTPTRGTVIAVGPGRDDGTAIIPMTLAVGDLVIYGKYSGTAIQLNNEEVIVIREPDVIARVKK